MSEIRVGLISGSSSDENIIRNDALCYVVLFFCGGRLKEVFGVDWCVLASVGIISRYDIIYGHIVPQCV